ncbi:MAG: hypothetical protein K2H96_06180 [Muribaculaceae bacterium]|nr:hypothetical protein [Muribaculaceae bacterium]
MSKLTESKGVAWAGLVLCVAVLVLSMVIPGVKKEWWELIDIFFIFMMVFSHLAALYLGRMSPPAGKMLDRLAFIFGVVGVIAFIVVFIINQ